MNARPEDAQGRYANFVAVTSQERDVVVDFASVVKLGDSPASGQLVARIFLNHHVADDLIRILQENKRRWEEARYEGGKEQT